MTPEQQPNTPPQPPQGRPAPQPGMAQPPLPQQPNAPQPWPAQQPPAAQPWPPQQPPQAWGAPQQPPAGPQDRQGALERHHVHHSYIWLGSIQTAVMLLVVVLFSMGSAIVGAISEGDTITSSDGPVLVIVGLCVAGGLVLVVGLVALYQWVSYKHLYYELGPEEFNLYSGIFNKKRVHVPYQRIQSVDQRASLLQRVFGVCTVSIDTAGGASNKAVTVPFVQKSQAEALRRELFSRKQYQLSVQNGADPAVAAAAAAAAAGMAVLYFANMAAAVGYALCFVLLVLDAIGAVLWFRGSGFSYNERFMQVSNGGFARETISFPRKKIQFGFTKTNPFQRRAHTATVNARTAAGIGGTTVRLIDVCEEDASAWLGWLKPHGNVVQ